MSTIRKTRRTASDFEVGTQYVTSDGKLVTLKHVCVEDYQSKVELKGIEAGRKVRLRNGDVLTFVKKISDLAAWPYRFTKEDGYELYFASDGSYYSSERCDDRDVVEILPLKQGRVSLAAAAAGDQFQLRNGQVRTYAGDSNGSYAGNLRTTGNGRDLYFRADGSCPNRDDGYDVIKIIPAPREPRVSIEKAIKGDKFRLRDGYVCTYRGTRTRSGNLETLDEQGDYGLVIGPTGETPGLGYRSDVVEIIPAPTVSIKDAKIGDTFRLRNGREFECIRLGHDYCRAKGLVTDEIERTLSFACDGHCPGLQDLSLIHI
jgi:hypothetical protein